MPRRGTRSESATMAHTTRTPPATTEAARWKPTSLPASSTKPPSAPAMAPSTAYVTTRPAVYQPCAENAADRPPSGGTYRRDTNRTNGEHIPTQCPKPPRRPSVRNPSRSIVWITVLMRPACAGAGPQTGSSDSSASMSARSWSRPTATDLTFLAIKHANNSSKSLFGLSTECRPVPSQLLHHCDAVVRRDRRPVLPVGLLLLFEGGESADDNVPHLRRHYIAAARPRIHGPGSGRHQPGGARSSRKRADRGRPATVPSTVAYQRRLPLMQRGRVTSASSQPSAPGASE